MCTTVQSSMKAHTDVQTEAVNFQETQKTKLFHVFMSPVLYPFGTAGLSFILWKRLST